MDDSRPLFLQIAEQIENDIIDGALPEESQVPSTNEFAAFHRINPATAGKGVNLLVDDGVLYKKRGIGMFVAEGARDRLVESLELFGIGYSWGGFESLAVPAEPDPIRTASKRDYGGPLVRLHIGLEDPDDIIADLAQALAQYPAG